LIKLTLDKYYTFRIIF